jgi:tetrapyrrole methylase family protein/MazG family protein
MSDATGAFARLLSIIQRLRGPNGCPWDREQSPRTLRAALIEEAWECISAIDLGDDANMEEELGDLYLLVTMMSWMKEQEGAFSVESALAHIAEKLIRRHPHVFAGEAKGSAEQVLVQWDEIKAREKRSHAAAHGLDASAPPSSLDGVPASFPPLEKAAKLQKKAAKVGFDWPDPQPVWDKIEEELDELRSAVKAGTDVEIEAEVGDILFSVVNLSRLLRVDPALALHRTNVKFERRFREVERRLAAAGLRPAEAGLDRMDELWNQVKSEELPAADPAGSETVGNEPAGSHNASK